MIVHAITLHSCWMHRVLYQVFSHGLVKTLGLSLALAWMCGCQQNSSAPNPKTVTAVTPKDQFDRFLDRLEHVIDMGQPSPMAGIRVNHTLSHQYYVPQQPDLPNRAEVVIRTVTEDILSSENNSVTADLQVSDDNIPERNISSALESIGNQNPKLHLDDGPPHVDTDAGDPPAPNAGATLPKRAVRPKQSVAKPTNISIEEEREYELLFRDNRWQLVTELENETERLWFEYALKN